MGGCNVFGVHIKFVIIFCFGTGTERRVAAVPKR